MKFLIYSDVHFSEYSSIIRSHGTKYSTRLENLIKSVNWAEDLAIQLECDEIVCLGDFFDRSDLNSREITALNEIEWADIPHTFLVGNHDASVKDLTYNSVNVLQRENVKVLNDVTIKHLKKCDILFIPYLLDEDRKSIKEYFDTVYHNSLFQNIKKKRVVLSHNDIKRLQYGGFESKVGIDLDDIAENCDLFLNGHLHNVSGAPFAPHAFNVGNLTGQNFSEDAMIYTHRVFILDTENGTLNSIENPYAFNFYKLEIMNEVDLNKVEVLFENDLKNNAVLSIKCSARLKDRLLEDLNKISMKLIENRIIYIQEKTDTSNIESSVLLQSSADHLEKFIAFCRENISNNDILEEELAEVCKK